MMTIRKADARGRSQIDWLDSRHTFSFSDYLDPRFMGFRTLRVINDDRVAPGAGFGAHPHRDMEILSYVLDGALAHRDSTGGGGVIRPGDVQRMSAGRGVVHSEYNASETEPVHFLQIWIVPEARGLEPGYEQRRFDDGERRGRLRLIAARDGRDGALTIHQDVAVYAGLLGDGEEATHALGPGRHAWVHVARGEVTLGGGGGGGGGGDGERLAAGDGAALSGESEVRLRGVGSAEVLVFDLA